MVTSLFVVLMALVILAIVVRLVEARVAFFPSAGEDVTPSEFEVPYTADYVMSADGERLRVWALPQEEARASVVYFHGNGGNLSIWAPILAGIHREGYAVYAIDYRGYGLSTGRPSERGLFRDLDAFVPWARDRVPAGLPVVYWGRSLGGTMAAYAATVRAPDGVIIESGFPDARTLLRGSPPMSLLALFSSYRFSTTTWLRGVDRPVLVMHGDADGVVPFAAGRALFDAITGPKQFLRIPGGDHNDLAPRDARAYWSTIAAFVESLRP